MNLFRKVKYVPVKTEGSVFPDGLWVKCTGCGKTIFKRELDKYKICPRCGAYFRMTAAERINVTADSESFIEFDAELKSVNHMGYPGYDEKLAIIMEQTGITEAVITGRCRIEGYDCVIALMDSFFIMGSMGAVVGEKITRVFEYAYEHNLPVVIFTASGGARMQEGIVSLMQMAKISGAVARFSKKQLLYVTVITDPTTGGVTASFAMQGDIILAEPGALVGFAGRRVIEQTLKEKLPDNFQTAEFMLEHGFIDKLVQRERMKETLGCLFRMHKKG